VGGVNGEQLEVRSFADIRAEPTLWLPGWEGVLPLGRPAILYGEEKTGKGLWWISVAAELSQKGKSTLIFATEDVPEQDVLPRFLAAGGKRERLALVRIKSPKKGELPRELDLGSDHSFFEQAIERTGASLVVVDPLIGQIDASLDSYKAQHVRAFMRPLAATVLRQGAAFLGVIHLNRAPSNIPMNRVSAAKAFRELARSTLFFGRDPDEPDGLRRVLALDASNLADDRPASRVFEVEPILVEADGHRLQTARLRFVGFGEHRARDLLGVQVNDERPKEDAAKAFLQRALLPVGEWHEAAPIKKAAEAEGISDSTLKRARLDLLVEYERTETFPSVTRWRLPTVGPRSRATPFPLNGGPTGEALCLSQKEAIAPNPLGPTGETAWLSEKETVKARVGPLNVKGTTGPTAEAAPLLGDEMYPVMLAEAVRDGYITHAEADEAYAVHKLVVAARERKP
jgi:AAA domain